MALKRTSILIPLMLIGALYLFWSCSVAQQSTKPLVIVSIPPYHDLVKAIVGESVDVISALPEGYDPHTSEITPRRIESLQKGALWIGIGESYEKNLTQALLQANPQMEMLQLTPQTDPSSLSDHTQCPIDNHGNDPHFWLSLAELRPQMLAITAALIRLWPKNLALYQDRVKKLLDQIDHLNTRITTALAPAKGKAILTSHAALRYFCRDYDLIELALECHGKSPLPQDVTSIVTTAKEKRPLCAIGFSHQSTKTLYFLAKTLDLPIYSLQLLGPNALKTIDQLATDITQSLSFENQEE
ncbi:MAG: zinc ABC transporter substrate-binding protein [Chlamydiota bacterium]